MRTALLAASVLMLAACQNQAGSGGARDQVRVVGSSTVFPFATATAELFVLANPGMKPPIIEQTGTGAGMKLFCSGLGAQFPDIENASRRIKASEFEQCAENGVGEITEIQIGVDGLAFAESRKGPSLALTPRQIYEALADSPYGKGPNRAKRWSDIDPALPSIPIAVYGPPATSGTRDSLAELVLMPGCETNPEMVALKASDADKHKALCTRIREDGAYVDAGENDNLIVQKLGANPDAIGVFGFSYLDANRDTLRDIPLSGVAATYESVADGSYPGARPLYIYVKKAHLRAVPGLKAYVEAFAKNWGPDGALARRGMVAATEPVRRANAEIVANMTSLTGDALE